MHQIWRLSEASDDNLGLACTHDGLMLGRTPLIERRDGRFAVREKSEIERLLRRAYGGGVAIEPLMPGLAAVAKALDADDLLLARITAVHPKVPDIAHGLARQAMEAEDRIIKYGDSSGANWNPELHPRTGTPPNPGWFGPASGAGDNASRIRTSQSGAAPTSTELQSSSKPGDHFPTASAAAIAALLSVYDVTRSTNLEHSGRIYQNPDGSFSYTQGLTDSQRDPSIPNRNCCSYTSTPGSVPPGTTDMGSYHAHTDHPGSTSAEFSNIDVVFYTYTDKLPGYAVGTNAQGVGELLQFTPGETVKQGITQILGTVSNGTFAPNPAYDPNRKPLGEGPDSYDPERDDR